MVTYEILNQFFQDLVTPRLFITTGPHGFATSWVNEMCGLWHTHYTYNDRCIDLEAWFLLSLRENYVPGPRYMWDFLAACFADALEEQQTTVAVIRIPPGHESDHSNIVTLLLDTVQQLCKDMDDSDERLKVLLVGENAELDYRAISNQLRMSQRFYNFTNDGFDQQSKTYAFRLV